MKFGLLAVASLLCAGCAQVAPMSPPEASVAPAFKEARGPGPGLAAADIGNQPLIETWWTAFRDPELDGLQQQLIDNSPDLASALARYQQARAATNVLRAAQSPSLGVGLDVERNRQSERRPLRVPGANSPDHYNSAMLGLDLQYDLDLWGRVRQQVEAGVAQEQAAAADLAAARLVLQTQLADTFFALRGLDREAALLRESSANYARAAELIGNRHRDGIASGLDLARSQALLDSTRSQAHQLQAQRAVLEHAVAALVGANASTFVLAPSLATTPLPAMPIGLPSMLLQRRADIAAARRRVTAANASVGVTRAAFFPSLTLGLAGGFQSGTLSRFVEAPNIFWAIGPDLAATVFDGGRRKAEQARAEAVLDEAGQRYRAVVLGAFQQVEDQLALLAEYSEAAAAEERAVAASRRAVELATHRYKEGAASYLEVVTAQTAHLQARRSALDIETRQRRATAQLARALGGGWSETL
ncbi:efflux transporter, outer membrane factor (OMF) lipoprotein, NodT family [Variovorax sp. YR266]|uniref:efflux transporter outer membrane subunit n=1 Tax=Variovorax sp. YR266 TaxID=1884386 RepID=UPI00089B97AB|nr:efflux transporter outer membrane subunit [Variovorax sp. YR266]SDZ70780.1 efflux transporter, outer membrane factor (OMF) lipoprotein, NodT family [Variovorax sp. YR266]